LTETGEFFSHLKGKRMSEILVGQQRATGNGLGGKAMGAASTPRVVNSNFSAVVATSQHGKFRVLWLGSRVVSVLDSGAEGPGFKLQPRRCPVTVLGKLLTPIVPLFTKQQNW